MYIDKILSNKLNGKDISTIVDNMKARKIEVVVELINFVLQVAGVPCLNGKVIQEDVDLDGLDSEEISELLSDSIHKMSESDTLSYPLLSNSKVTKQVRTSYRKFWNLLVNEMLGNGDEDKYGIQGIQLIELLSNILASLSSVFVINIRDSATEAVLSLARTVRSGLLEANIRLTTIKRQLAAEKSNSNRYQAILKNKGRLDNVMECVF